FFGGSAGGGNTTGSFNAFLGDLAGTANTTGSNNTIIGNQGNVGTGNLQFATALGANARVNTSDTIVLGKVAGDYGFPSVARPADTVQIPGDLNVNGSLSLNIVNAGSQYNLGGNRFLSANLALANTSLGQNSG